jgi:hypothetical protein
MSGVLKYLLASVLILPMSVYAESVFSVTTSLGDNATFLEGDPIEFLIESSEPGYLYLFIVDTQGAVSLIFPNSVDKDNELDALYMTQVPSLTAGYQFKASPPYGQEVVIALRNETAVDVVGLDIESLAHFKTLMASIMPSAIQAEAFFTLESGQ